MMNKLAFETSPYLLQHAHNPVDWHAWKPEAFEKAKAENKPILVSIGYSTCHWCHVMERESFENQDVAQFMNENFINIKVDREERPDVDNIYMEACQILTGGGGWPLNCFLLPDGRPFYAGTYFPPRPAHGRPSWLQLLIHLSNIWQTKRDVAEEQAEKLTAHIQRNDGIFLKKTGGDILGFENGGIATNLEKTPFTEGLLNEVFYRMRENFDRSEGGFGGAPKFPSTMAIQFLLNHAHFNGNHEALEHALFSLKKMISGGIYDQLGGGFARYSTDREWLVPHFEKMLYDNALLVSVISEAYKISGEGIFSEAVEETLEYVRREMTHPEGGFFSAQDADSEGVEGKFFVWGKNEIAGLLGTDAEIFCQFYDVSEHGNWEGENILWRPTDFETFARNNGRDVQELKNLLQACREKLFRARSLRIHPGLDDKILIGWNALMVSAHATAFSAFQKIEYRDAAVRNLAFCLDKFSSPENFTLKHTWKNGQNQYDAFLDDYAFFIAALIDVYQITFEPRYLELAGKYAERVLSSFFDSETRLFFFTGEEQADVILRRKDLYDNATPSGNSTMAHNLQRLGILLDRPDWRELASQMLLSMLGTVKNYPLSFERWAAAVQMEVHGFHEIAVVGSNAFGKATAINAMFLPNKVIAAAESESAELPLLVGKEPSSDALIYVCRDFTCLRPVSELPDFEKLVFGA